MPTILGSDGDTTGALVTNITTEAELTAMVLPATHDNDGALTSADWDYLQAIEGDLPDTTPLANLQVDGFTLQAFATAVVDLKTNATHDFVMPTVTGKVFVYGSARLELVSRAANVTGNLKFVMAQGDVAISEEIDCDKADINHAATGAGLPATIHVDQHDVKSAAMDASVVQFKITQGAVSVGAVTGRMIMAGYYEDA